MTPEQKDQALKVLAEGIVNKALDIEWRDTESQARRIANHAAEALLELTQMACTVRNANTPYEFNCAVKDLIEYLLGDLPNG